jgi:hypothetical protein
MLFGSKSSTNQTSNSETTDNRQVAEGGAKAINSEGGSVVLTEVADEAFELAEFALNTNSAFMNKAFDRYLTSDRPEAAQLGADFIKWAIPAIAVIYFLSKGAK